MGTFSQEIRVTYEALIPGQGQVQNHHSGLRGKPNRGPPPTSHPRSMVARSSSTSNVVSGNIYNFLDHKSLMASSFPSLDSEGVGDRLGH